MRLTTSHVCHSHVWTMLSQFSVGVPCPSTETSDVKFFRILSSRLKLSHALINQRLNHKFWPMSHRTFAPSRGRYPCSRLSLGLLSRVLKSSSFPRIHMLPNPSSFRHSLEFQHRFLPSASYCFKTQENSTVKKASHFDLFF